MSPIPLVLLDVDTGRDRAYLLDLAEACTVTSQRDFGRAEPAGYGIGAVVRVAQSVSDIAPGEWTIAFLSHPDMANALGYHDVAPNGRPLGKIFPLLDDPEDVSVTVTHELFEMLGDADVNTSVVGPDGIVRSREACDPVESTSYRYTCASGRVLLVSNFVTPAYFSPAPDMSAPLDFMGLVATPGQLLPGGYQIVWDAASKSWTQITKGKRRPYRAQLEALGVGRMARRAPL